MRAASPPARQQLPGRVHSTRSWLTATGIMLSWNFTYAGKFHPAKSPTGEKSPGVFRAAGRAPHGEGYCELVGGWIPPNLVRPWGLA